MMTIAMKIKRVIDILGAFFGLVLLLPLLALIALLVWVTMGEPIFFRQWRVGLQGKRFRVYKFRTMTNERDGRGELLPDEERLRPFGRWLRRTSLDELPQLVNVLLGQMSLVGPRALPIEYFEKIPPKYARRFDVKPGLTGWTQVHYQGKNRTLEEKCTLDVQYVENQSLLLDLKIMFLTIGALVRRFKFNKRGDSLATEVFDE